MSAQNTRLARHKATQEVGNAVVLLEQYLCAEKKAQNSQGQKGWITWQFSV